MFIGRKLLSLSTRERWSDWRWKQSACQLMHDSGEENENFWIEKTNEAGTIIKQNISVRGGAKLKNVFKRRGANSQKPKKSQKPSEFKDVCHFFDLQGGPAFWLTDLLKYFSDFLNSNQKPHHNLFSRDGNHLLSKKASFTYAFFFLFTSISRLLYLLHVRVWVSLVSQPVQIEHARKSIQESYYWLKGSPRSKTK